MRQAAAAWLRAVIVRVPIWTGFARGSLKFADGPRGNLSRFLNVAVPTGPSKPYPKWYYHPGRQRIRKIPENAGRFAHYTFSTTRRVYTFTYTTTVIHFILEEFFGVVSGPWEAGEAGREAWAEFMETHVQSLPKISKYNIKVPMIDITRGQLKVLNTGRE